MLQWIKKNIRPLLVATCFLLLTVAALLEGWMQIFCLILAAVAGGYTLYFLLAPKPVLFQRKNSSPHQILQTISQEELLLPPEESEEE